MNEPVHISVLVDHAVAEAELRTEYPDIRGLHTGVDEVDERLSPVLEAGRLIVMAGESGRGKTALATQWAVAFAHQVPVLWMCLEDDTVDATRRALANVGRVPVSGLRSGFRIGTVPEGVYDGARALSELPLWVEGQTDNVMGIARRTMRWAKSHAPAGHIRGVLIVDQLSHILPMPYSQELNAELERKGLPTPPRQNDLEHKIFEWQVAVLREVAVRLQMLVVVLHQLNDARDDAGRPNESSIRSSRGIVHKADAVVIPWRPRTIENPFPGPGQPARIPAPEDAAELIGVKGRTVPQFVAQLRWDGAHQRFASPSEAIDESNAQPYAPPAQFTERALEGAKKLADLRTRLELQRSLDRQPAGELGPVDGL